MGDSREVPAPTPPSTPDPTRRVVVVVYDRFQSLDAFGPIEVFDHASTALRRSAYRLELCAPEAGPVRSSSGVTVLVEASLADVEAEGIDTLLMAGGDGVYAQVDRPAVVDHVRRLAASARRVASVCSGAYLLAEAGLLDGRRATTHWITCEDFQRRYPAIDVDPEPIFVQSGNVATSAGVTAGMDLALHFVEQDHDHALALDVARSLVLFLRRPGSQAQLSAPLAGQLAGSSTLRDLQGWVVEHLADDLTVAQLAARSHQTPRTFARRFRQEVDMTPARWVEQLRLEQARRLLEETHEPIDRIARRCGLEPEAFRRMFHRLLGVGPLEYRRRFGAPEPARSDHHPTPARSTP